MNILQTILLGIIQGLTEFLPVSSSGHLVIFQNLLGLKEPELLLDTTLHLGTLLAVCIYFRSDLGNMVLGIWKFLFHGKAPESREETHRAYAALTWWVLIGTIPTGLMGFFFRRPFESLFGSVSLVAVMLLVTGTVVGLTRFKPGNPVKGRPFGYLVSLAIGTAQGLAIIPGISRSGATIACGLFLGLKRETAGRFSFLLSIPAIVGAMLLQLKDARISTIDLFPLVCGFCSSAVVGLLALKVLMGMVRKGHLAYFAPYCWALGLLVLAVIH
jgi:undecaprenyl-diphosphatase